MKNLMITIISVVATFFIASSCVKYIIDTNDIKTNEVSVESIIEDSVATNKIVFWGHSAGYIVEPFIEELLKEKFPYSFDFERCSVNGETMLQIAARQGSIPAFFYGSNSVREGKEYVIADIKRPLLSSFDGSSIQFSIVNGVNPCIINGVSGLLTREEEKYVFKPNDNHFSILPNTKNIVKTEASSAFRFPLFSFFWCDQASDRDNIGTLIRIYQQMVSYTGNGKCLIIGSIRGDNYSHERVESLLATNFESRYFNARKYLISEGEKHYEFFSQEDQARITEGMIPRVWMKDEVHLNGVGAEMVAKEVVRLAIYNYLSF